MSCCSVEKLEKTLIPVCVEKAVNLMGSTTGRDKTFRLFQYSLRFLKIIMEKNKKLSANPTIAVLIQKMALFATAMSMTRSAMRIGRSFTSYSNVVRNIMRHRQNRKDPSIYNKWNSKLYTSAKCVSDLGLMNYFFFDNVLYLCKLGVLKNESLKKSSDKISNYGWIFDCLGNIVADLYEMNLVVMELTELRSVEGGVVDQAAIDVKNKRIKELWLGIIKCTLDIPTILFFIDDKKYVTPFWAQGLGVIATLISLYNLWPK
jgi:Peroxisomal biogenesis factor 11 (PEX11)